MPSVRLHDFIADKDRKLGEKWPKSRIRKLIKDALKAGGYDDTFLSRENLLLVQQAFGPLFRDVDREHPRKTQKAKSLITADYEGAMRQYFSERRIKESGAVYHVAGDDQPFGKDEAHLWAQYCKWVKMAEVDSEMKPLKISRR